MKWLISDYIVNRNIVVKKNKKFFVLITSIEIVVLIWIGLIIANKYGFNPFNRSDSQVKGIQTFKYFYSMDPNQSLVVKTDWMENEVINVTNQDSLNERFNYSIKKPKDTFRIISLGDSFTYGIYVNTENNWSERLEDKLNSKSVCSRYKKFEVINLGASGFDIPYEVEMYRRKGQKYDPDLVIWMLVDNKRIIDIINPLIEKCLDSNPQSGNEEGPGFDDRCWIEASNQINRDYANEYLSRKFNDIYDYYKGRIMIVDLDGSHKNILKKTERFDDLSILNLEYANKKELMFPEYHPNNDGHKYFSEKIYDYLIKNQIIDCE